MKNVHLLVIDMQNDFCDTIVNGATLSVDGAWRDANRLATFIDKNSGNIAAIHATMDSHNTVHIAHPIFWVNSKGEHPSLYTIISVDDVKNGVWMTTNPAWKQIGIEYVTELAHNGRFPLCIWPPHTLVGRWGQSLYPCIAQSLTKWEENNVGMVNFIAKGMNRFTENYSAIRADVPDRFDPSTHLNIKLINSLEKADQVLISGEALSHCVRNTVMDIADNISETDIGKLVLLTDTCSNVGGFENLGNDFVRDMVARGMKLSSTVDYSF